MTKSKAADYTEALEILTEMARTGDVRAAIALAGHLREERPSGQSGRRKSVIDELASRRPKAAA